VVGDIRDPSELTTVQKAAVLVMNLPEELVRELLSQLSPEQVRAVGTTVANLPRVAAEVIEEVCLEFVNQVVSPVPRRLEGRKYLHHVFPRVTDPQMAKDLVREIEGLELRSIREWLRTVPHQTLASVLSREHPQTIAVVCALAEPRVTGLVVKGLPEGVREEVLFRQAMLSELPAEVLGEIEEVLVREVAPKPVEARTDLEGVESTAAVLKNMPPEEREEALQRIRKMDEELAEMIMRSMYSFDTLYHADDRGIQALLKVVDRKDLTVALKGTTLSVQEKFFKNMSERAATFLAEDLEVLGPMRTSDVEEAQRRIMAQALVLESEGNLMFMEMDEGDMFG